MCNWSGQILPGRWTVHEETHRTKFRAESGKNESRSRAVFSIKNMDLLKVFVTEDSPPAHTEFRSLHFRFSLFGSGYQPAALSIHSINASKTTAFCQFLPPFHSSHTASHPSTSQLFFFHISFQSTTLPPDIPGLDTLSLNIPDTFFTNHDP